jgi:hypothetical protein
MDITTTRDDDLPAVGHQPQEILVRRVTDGRHIFPVLRRPSSQSRSSAPWTFRSTATNKAHYGTRKLAAPELHPSASPILRRTSIHKASRPSSDTPHGPAASKLKLTSATRPLPARSCPTNGAPSIPSRAELSVGPRPPAPATRSSSACVIAHCPSPLPASPRTRRDARAIRP